MITHFEVGTLVHQNSRPTHDFDLTPDRETRVPKEHDKTWRLRKTLRTDDEPRTMVELNASPALNAKVTSPANDAPAAEAKAEIQGTEERYLPHLR